VTLHVWRSERADGLLRPLATLLSNPPDDPFTPEVVAVPTAGIERWVTQELALRLGTAGEGATDGICANVDFPFPGAVVSRALEAAAGLGEYADRWRPDQLVWVLLALHDADPDAHDRWGPAASHLRSADDGRRYAAARRVADLFDRYAVHRPDMVRAWATGDDVGPDLGPLAAGHRWQPALWRAAREAVGHPSTAERLADATARLAADEVELDLPARLSVFGLSALPSSYLEVLLAMAGPREVHLFLRHPSPDLWRRIEEVARTTPLRRVPRDDDPTADQARHPLLRSWGRDAREMQTVFAALDAPSATHVPVDTDPPATLLSRIQADVRDDRPPVGAPVADTEDARPLLDPEDRSVQIHASHGRLRQVQVLRDAILHLLADDPTLEPRDIIVMCPDVESFAPYVDAVFGAHVASTGDLVVDDGQDRHRDTPALRVRIADRSLRQTNPVLKVVAELLDLADDRLTGPQVFDLLGRTPVRRRFRFSDDDLARLETWIPELGIRWGLDADDRVRYDLGGLDVNTWRFGMRRLLVGVAVADEDLRLVADVVPFDDVEGSDVELAGRFAECIARLTTILTGLRAPRPLADWTRALADAADQLTLSPGRDAWQAVQLHRLLDALLDEAADAARTVELSLADLRSLLGDRLRGRPSRASHRTGDLTVSTLVPMRAVPHRVVCLLGMDDGSFPRRTVPDGDDLVDLQPFVGDRDARTEDRQLLLDALLAATDHLIVTYSGRDERTNEPLPPAVPVGELLDVVDATVRTGEVDAGGREVPARRRVLVEHPLQPFDRRNYAPGALVADRPWSFDRVGLAGARAHAGPQTDPPPLLDRPLEPRREDGEVVDLGQLVRFLEHPVRFFLSERLGVSLRAERGATEDGIPLDLTGLPKWGVGDRLLQALRRGHTREGWERVERARGTLPPEPLATAILDEVCPVVEQILDTADELYGGEPPRSEEVLVRLGAGRRLVGTVGGLHGEVLGHATYSSLKAKDRVAAYARLVALTAMHPEVPWRAVLVGRVSGSQAKKKVEVCQLDPLGADPEARADEARKALERLIDLHDRGMTQPAPLYGQTSEEIVRQVRLGKGPWGASKCWETSWSRYGGKEDIDPCHVAVLGRVLTFDELMEAPPAPDEQGDGWVECRERVVAWAHRLWDPILDLEHGSKR
jgi:exodeoxyribonuclease V gamma subunit